MNTAPSIISLGDSRYDYATANALLASRIHNAGVPFVKAGEGRFGGPFWTCVTLSLDARESWSHGILENSRYARLAVTIEGLGESAKFVVESFSGGGRHFGHTKLRKFRARTLEDVADRIANWALLNTLPVDVAARRAA